MVAKLREELEMDLKELKPIFYKKAYKMTNK